MFKRLILGESVYAVAVPIAISILVCLAVKTIRFQGLLTLEEVIPNP